MTHSRDHSLSGWILLLLIFCLASPAPASRYSPSPPVPLREITAESPTALYRPSAASSCHPVILSSRKLDFLYDTKGRRIARTISTWTGTAYQATDSRKFLYDGWKLVAEINATNNLPIRSYTWLGNELVEMVQDGVSYLPGYDANGNLTALKKRNGHEIMARYEYGPFGILLKASGPMAMENPIRFSSEYQDPITGLIYYGYRYYNPATQRWLSRDPIGILGGYNLYALANNDPVNGRDYLGLDIFLWSGGGTAGHNWTRNPPGGAITTPVNGPSLQETAEMVGESVLDKLYDFGGEMVIATMRAPGGDLRDQRMLDAFGENFRENHTSPRGRAGHYEPGSVYDHAGTAVLLATPFLKLPKIPCTKSASIAEDLASGLPNLSRRAPNPAAGSAGVKAPASPKSPLEVQVCEEAATTVANPVPSTLARVVPGEGPFPTLGPSTRSDVYVTDAAAIRGMTPAQISQGLGIQSSDTYTLFQFPTPSQGLASPVFRSDPGFIGGGLTSGGAPEFVIPNGPIPAGGTMTIIRTR